jgi:hypothetical protein
MEKREHEYMIDGNVNYYNHMENGMGAPPKIRNRTTL